jgi:hypothetical protein
VPRLVTSGPMGCAGPCANTTQGRAMTLPSPSPHGPGRASNKFGTYRRPPRGRRPARQSRLGQGGTAQYSKEARHVTEQPRPPRGLMRSNDACRAVFTHPRRPPGRRPFPRTAACSCWPRCSSSSSSSACNVKLSLRQRPWALGARVIVIASLAFNTPRHGSRCHGNQNVVRVRDVGAHVAARAHVDQQCEASRVLSAIIPTACTRHAQAINTWIRFRVVWVSRLTSTG